MAIPHRNSLPASPARWPGGSGVAFGGDDDGSLVAILKQLRVTADLAGQLQAMVRPSNLVARVGADEFAIRQDGLDPLTAAERAEAPCAGQIFHDPPGGHGTHFSIGIASRAPGSTKGVRILLRRAHMAAREAKRTDGGGWRVSHAEPILRGQGFPG